MSKMKITIDKDKFNPKYIDTFTNTRRYQILFGGSSSGKSYAIGTMIPLWVLQGHSILVLRKNQASISKSTWLEINKSISNLGLLKYFNINKSDKTITSKVSTGCVMFAGVYPDTEKLKSITPIYDTTFSKLVLEEATEFSLDDFNEILLRQRGGSRFAKCIILLFNPIFKTHWIYKRFFESIETEYDFNNDCYTYTDDTLSILKTTYIDNNYLGPEEIETLTSMKTISPYHWNVYGKGNFGVLGELCFDHHIVKDFNLSTLGHDDFEVRIGMDFGFTNDPTAIIFCLYNRSTKTVYVFDEVYGKKMYEEDMAKYVQDLTKLHNLKYPTIYADNADPRIISRLNDLNCYVTGAKKGTVKDGVFWLKKTQIVIHPRCEKLIEEFSLYTFKKNKDGEVTSEPIDKYNHGIDSLRYALVDDIRGGTQAGSELMRI